MKKVVFALVIMTCGCVSQNWAHRYKGAQDFYRDTAKCESMSMGGNTQMMYGGSAFANGWNQGAAMGAQATANRIYQGCMMGEGWYLVSK